MLHAFQSGAYDNGVFSTTRTPNDGKELLAYMPDAVITSIEGTDTSVDFTSPQYSHNNYVDATPATADLYYGGAWHTWLVGGLGAAGNPGGTINDATSTANGVLYALDITDPSKFLEKEAKNLVLGEWNSSNLACIGDITASPCKASLGSVYGTPIIRRLHDGNWAVIFGNGRNSATGIAGIFIMTVAKADGARTFRFLDTGVKSTANKNGIDQVTSADLDGDHVTDYVYAGDATGNLWHFDLTSTDPANWVKTKPKLLFTTGEKQPISTRVMVTSALPRTGSARLIVTFGTGRSAPQTTTGAASYASGAQAIFGIWDWDRTDWNKVGSVAYASLAGVNSYGDNTTDLQTQSITTANGNSDIPPYRSISQAPVCWKGSNACKDNNTKYGWKLALPAGEQIIYNPIFAYGVMLVNTSVPEVDKPFECISEPASGFTMAVSLETGGAPATSFFGTAAMAAGIGKGQNVAGLKLNATGSPSIVTAINKPFLVQQTVSTEGIVTQIDPPPQGMGKRVTWIKMR